MLSAPERSMKDAQDDSGRLEAKPGSRGPRPFTTLQRKPSLTIMLIITFNDEEVRRISEESPTFAAKIASMAVRKQTGTTGPDETLNVKHNANEQPARDYFATIHPKNGTSVCIGLMRTWAKENGIHRYSSLAGATRLVMELAKEAKNSG